jgi:hypothetical protein
MLHLLTEKLVEAIMAGNTSVELVSIFCNATTHPLFTLPEEFCDCEKWLRSPSFIAAISVGVVILVLVLMIGTWHQTWLVTAGNIVIEFFSLPESERREFMMKLAQELSYKELCEWKETQSASQGIAPTRLSTDKVSSSSSMTLC